MDLELIELLFFAYRDFVGEADHILEAIGYGRAHHRVVYFVMRNPGLRVSDLLEILQITKQSLGRVLKQLVDDGYIEQRPGPVDRRERLLYASEKGERLANDLSARQRIYGTIAHEMAHHWQASQPGSSMAQNLMSVAGSAAISTGAVAAAAVMCMAPSPPCADTALSWPARPVDFSACVAEVVRR